MKTTLVAVSIAACCLLNCYSKLPTPIISGPDSGWVRAPVLFRALNPDGSPNRRQENWMWGDGKASSSGIHYYAAPGTYSITYVTISVAGAPAPTLVSDPSKPCTLRILEDTLVHPDSIVATIATGPRVWDWACVLPDGSRLYVTNAAADSVSVIDAANNSVTASVAVPDSPTCCIASNSGQFVYVSCLAAQSVAVIDVGGDSVVRTISIDGSPAQLAVLPSDSFLYVAHADSPLVSVVGTGDDSVVARVAVTGTPTSIAVKPGGGYVYVTSETGNTITVIRTSDNAVVSSESISGGPADAELSPSGDTIYVCCPNGKNLVILRSVDMSTIQNVSYDSLGFPNPRHAVLLPGAQCLYVTATTAYSGPVIVRRSDNYLLRLTDIGKARMAVPSPDGSKVYVPSTTGVVVLGLRSGR